MWEAVDAKGLLSAHIVERKTMLITCLFHARGAVSPNVHWLSWLGNGTGNLAVMVGQSKEMKM